jgi:hypothetical protein
MQYYATAKRISNSIVKFALRLPLGGRCGGETLVVAPGALPNFSVLPQAETVDSNGSAFRGWNLLLSLHRLSGTLFA